MITAYVAGSVDPEAQRLLAGKPKARFAFFHLPGVLDQTTGLATFLRATPMWGGIYFAKLRHLLGRLLEPTQTALAAPISVFGIVLTLIIFASQGLMLAGRLMR